MRRMLCLTALGLALAGCGGGADEPLARVTLSPAELVLGYPEVRRVELTWEPLAELPGGGAEGAAGGGDESGAPVVFVHLLDAAGVVVRTFDHPFPAPWRPGSPVEDAVDLHQSALAPPLPSGRYRLTVGLYLPGGERLPLEGGEEVAGREYALATVTAAAPGPELPTLRLTGDWLPLAPGADRQVLARRWLAGDGAVRVEGAAAPGSLWMRLQVPVVHGASTRLLLAEGAAGQEVRVTSPCGGAEFMASGAGEHELELPVDPSGAVAAAEAGSGPTGAGEPAGGEPAAEAGCPVEIRASYSLVVQDTLERRSVLLETLAWRRR